MARRTNRTRYVLLGSLAEGPKSGYDIRQGIEAGISHFWHESYGQIYPELRALAAEGLAECMASEGSGRRRNVYRITEAGRAALARWLEEPVAEDPVRNELLLRLIFGRHTRPEVLEAHVRGFRDRAARLAGALSTIEALIGGEPEDHPDMAYWVMTLRAGQAIARARLSWADETLATLARLAGEDGDAPVRENP
jgi:PadR family transcriptional regulator AphA